MTLSVLSVNALLIYVCTPLVLLLVLSLMAIPCVLAPGARMSAAIKALHCYVMQSIGVALMTAGALPAVYGVLEKFTVGVERFSAEMYLALLILFSCGGVTFLWHEQLAEKIDDPSRRVPALLFWFTFRMIGYVLTLASLLLFFFTMLLLRPTGGTWWLTPFIVFVYGALLVWCTRSPVSVSAFRSMPMNGGSKAAAPKGKKK